MDAIAYIEPQLAIPVLGVVLFAVMIYIFGFQKTQEPSFQHLAVLQSSGKSRTANGLSKTKSAPSPRSTAKAKEKVVSNGSLVQVAAKENVKPSQQITTLKVKKEKNPTNIKEDVDVEGGDWIQAVSRKDKKTRGKKEELKSDANENKVKSKSPPPASKPRPILQEIELRAKLEQEIKKENDVKPAKEEKPVKPEMAGGNRDTNLSKQETKANSNVQEVTEEKPAPVAPKANAPADAKANVAFDEVGDLWEEAKSRGAKKKRARKD